MFLGYVDKNISPMNKFRVLVAGVVLRVTEFTEVTKTGNVADLPDFSAAATGTNQKVEFDITVPDHHAFEVGYLKEWYNEANANGDVPATAYRTAVLMRLNNDGSPGTIDTLINAFPSAETAPPGNTNDTNMAVRKFKLTADEAV